MQRPRLSLVLGSFLSLLLAACAPAHGASTAPHGVPAAPAGSASDRSRAGTTEGRGHDDDDDDDDDKAVDRAARAYLDLLVDIAPETATALGLHQADAKLDERTTRGFDAAVDREDAMARALRERFAKARLTPAARTDLAMLLSALDVDVRTKRVQRPLQRDPTLYLSPLDALFVMTARDYAPAAERARNVLSRLEKIPRVVEAAKENLLNPPRVWTEVAVDRASSAKGFFEAQRPFLIAALPSDTARVDAALHAATSAYEEYKRYLQKEVLPRSNGRFSAGRELFEVLLHQGSFVDESADEVLALGKRLFAETNAQMTEVARRIDPHAKGWPEVTARLKKVHPTADGLLDAYRAEVLRARTFLVQKDAAPLPPGDDLEVIDTPPFLRSTVTAAYDQPPPFDANTRGFFFVTPVDRTLPRARQEEMLRENDHGDLVDTAVHEAYPGHHLQLSFARLSPSLVRKALGGAIFSEGWALYAEELMAELGYYTDEERLMQLEWTLVRAARVIIDVGLHVSDMTFEQAVKLLTDDVHLERQLALSEVKRYTLSPTQPLSYLVGRQRIMELRAKYQQREGARFTLKRFHADVLSRGTVPPTLMAKEIFGG
ncbi:MAG: hypothetical protein JWP97_3730 [Labilithrix sp.]|nr:hypothetical protein [Labilithrix sp.]